MHHTELLADLVIAGRLDVMPDDDGRTVYHEPCSLARAGHAASAALTTIGGEGLLAARSGLRTFCCGGGGGNSFYQVEQEKKRISAIRYEELAATGADTIAVSCPFCLTMLRDAAGAQAEGGLPVVDVAEKLRERIRAPAGG